MIKFDRDQEVFDIGGVKVGGQPGELPPVMIGSLFHQGHGIVKDRESGIFNSEKASRLIRRQDEVSRMLGVGCMVDVVAETEEAMESNLRFVVQETESPFLVNAPTASVRIHGVRVARDLGALDRAVYDSVNYRVDEDERGGIKDSGVEAAIVQAFNPRKPMPDGMVEIVKGNGDREGLLSISRKAGITKPLLFTPVLDLPSVGFAARGIYLLKRDLGLPCGTAPVGVVGRSRQIKPVPKSIKRACRSSVVSMCQAMGADYIIYGTMARCRRVMTAAAVADAAISYNARTMGVRPRGESPLTVMFRSR